MALDIALMLSLLGSLVLASVLLIWADRVAGGRLLVLFLVGVAAWILGNALPNWLGAGSEPAALALLSTAPLTSAAFLHFAAVFTGTDGPLRAIVVPAYLVAGVVSLMSLLLGPGHFEPRAGVGLIALPNTLGWIAGMTWAGLAATGHMLLTRAWLRRPQGRERRQIEAVCAASGWGLLCMSGYVLAVLGFDMYPWPLLALPLYPVILVYGVLRHRVLVANAWARRALAWALLVGIVVMIVAALPHLLAWLGIGQDALPWLSGFVGALSLVIFGGPLRRLAERLVYPGGAVSATDIAAWRAGLASAETPQELAEAASRLISAQLRMPVAVRIGAAFAGQHDAPILACDPPGAVATMLGWENAPPGPWHAADLFGSVLVEEAARLLRAAALAERERARAEQARLLELGQLAATVAHDIRNPLNIISLAASGAPEQVRADIREQVGRVARLAQDLLDYAKPWRIETTEIDLAGTVRSLTRHYTGIEIGSGLAGPIMIEADPRRLQQAIGNLLDNARAAGGARIVVDAAYLPGGTVRLQVCDDGPGVPEEVRASLFTPFVSRASGGTGLGLAIVAKIAEAHGGSVTLEESPEWTTCFILTLPAR